MKRQNLLQRYASFPMLVWDMVDDGKVQRVADRAGLDHGTVMKWLRRRTHQPEADKVAKFARSHGLNLLEVVQLIARDTFIEVQGRPVPLPDLSGLKCGPAPDPNSARQRARRRTAVGMFAAAMALAAWGRVAEALPRHDAPAAVAVVELGSGRRDEDLPPVVPAWLTALPLIGSWLRRWTAWVGVFPRRLAGVSPTSGRPLGHRRLLVVA